MIFAAPVQRARLGNAAGCDAYLLSTTPPDPLAGFTWSARLQTHNGNNVPLGLYQDTACTIPATEDGHLIKGWKGELMGTPITATQADDQKAPMLVFNGATPTALFDGVDDFLGGALTAFGAGDFTAFSAMQPNSLTGNQTILQLGGGSGVGSMFLQSSDGTHWDYDAFATAIIDTSAPALEIGTSVVGSYRRTSGNSAAWSDGVATTPATSAVSYSITGNTYNIGRVSDPMFTGQYFDGYLVAILVSPESLSNTDRVITENYLGNLT